MNPPGLPRRSRTIFLMPLSSWAFIATRSSFAPASLKPDSRTYPTVPSASSRAVTSRRWILARTRVTSNSSRSCRGAWLAGGAADAPGAGDEAGAGAGASNRWMWSLTSLPALPRTRSRASSGVRPSRRRAVDHQDHVARLQPGLLGRRALDRRDDHEEAVGPDRCRSRWCCRSGRPTRSRRRCPRTSRDVVERGRVVGRAQVRRVRIADGLDEALDRALDERRSLDRIERVALRDVLVDRPERLPGIELGGRSCRRWSRCRARAGSRT